MAARSLSLQDQFLNGLRRGKLPVTIFLLKGVKLGGTITSFDTFSLLLRRDGASQLVYKHAISTIVPASSPADLDGVIAIPEAAARPSLQDVFLTAATQGKAALTLFLVNGVVRQGTVRAFDQFCVLLERSGEVQLIYKHAISTLQPDHPLDLGQHRGETAMENDPE